MELLKISRKEAEELYISDHENLATPEMLEMERKARALKRYEKSDTPRKKSSRERKVDHEKKQILALLEGAIRDHADTAPTVKNEAEFSFFWNGNSYTAKLIKHRPPKK